jgi:anti-sigma28 factor (negative regulator of flagellin synthesis)
MRIDDTKAGALGASQPGTLGASQPGRTHGAETVDPGRPREQVRSGDRPSPDNVNLSALAEQMQALQPDSAAQQARLERLSAQVATGHYKPDPERLSETLVNDALQDARSRAETLSTKLS